MSKKYAMYNGYLTELPFQLTEAAVRYRTITFELTYKPQPFGPFLNTEYTEGKTQRPLRAFVISVFPSSVYSVFKKHLNFKYCLKYISSYLT